MRGFLLIVAIGCGGDHLPLAPHDDYDRDGVPNAEDCAPYDAEVSGDIDGDGWHDVRCAAGAKANGYFLLEDPAAYLDCDDRNAAVAPGGAVGAPVYWERALTFDTYDGTLPGSDVCVWLDANETHRDDPRRPFPSLTEAAYDGVDNDCDGFVDIPDLDGDGYVAAEYRGSVAGNGLIDCDDCGFHVNPGIDERATADDCPIYAYDDVDNDCAGDGDLTDFDGDGFDGGGWASGTCDDVINLTTGERLAALATGPDCDDLRLDTYPAAPEFCDGWDYDCDDQPYSGFGFADDGLRQIWIDPGTTQPATHQTGQTPERALPSVSAAVGTLDACPEVHLLAGRYLDRVRIDQDVFADFGAPPEQLRFIGEPGVVLDGDGGRFLRVQLEPDQALGVFDADFVGGDDERGGLRVEGGRVWVEEASFTGIASPADSAFAHLGVTDESIPDNTHVTTVRHTDFVGNGGFGGATIWSDTALVEHVTFRGNTSDLPGGAMALSGFTTATVRDATFDGNTSAWLGGGLYAVGGWLNLGEPGAPVALTGNAARLDGGGVYVVLERLTIGDPDERSESRFALTSAGNVSTDGNGGGLALFATEVDVVGVEVGTDDHAGRDGAGMFVLAEDVSVTRLRGACGYADELGGCAAITGGSEVHVTDVDVTCTDDAERAEQGGGLWVKGQDVALTDVAVQRCNADAAGGGLFVDGAALTIDGLTLSGNTAGSGGGAYIRGARSPDETEVIVTLPDPAGEPCGRQSLSGAIDTVHLSGPLDVRDNDATEGDGGGLMFEGGRIRITPDDADVHLEGNTADGAGGGLWVVTAAGVTIDGLAVRGGGGIDADLFGGGLGFESVTTADLRGLDLDGLAADVGGGCIYAANTGVVTVDGRLSGCSTGGYGGALYAESVQDLRSTDLTVTDSVARSNADHLWILNSTGTLCGVDSDNTGADRDAPGCDGLCRPDRAIYAEGADLYVYDSTFRGHGTRSSVLASTDKTTLANVMIAENATSGAENLTGGILLVHASTIADNGGTGLINGLTGQLIESCSVVVDNTRDLDASGAGRVTTFCLLSAGNTSQTIDDALAERVCTEGASVPWVDPGTHALVRAPDRCDGCRTGLFEDPDPDDSVEEEPEPQSITVNYVTTDAFIYSEEVEGGDGEAESQVTVACGAEDDDADIRRFSFGYEPR